MKSEDQISAVGRPSRRRTAIAGALAAVASAALLGAPADPAAAQDTVRANSIFDDWAAFVTAEGPSKFCYAATVPVDTVASRSNVSRGDPFLLVATYPESGVTNEISVRLGFPADGDKTLSLRIGTDEFKFFNDGEEAWLERPSQNAAAIDAMRRGAKAFVTATSARGTTITDEYSLIGFTKALEKTAELCK